MQIQAIQNYNQHKSRNNTSFKNFQVSANIKQIFATPDFARPFVEELGKWQSNPLNLREMINVNELTPTGKRVLKEFFKQINNEAQIQDYPISMWIETPDYDRQTVYPRYHAKLPGYNDEGNIELDEWRLQFNSDKCNIKFNRGKNNYGVVEMGTFEDTKQELGKCITSVINRVAEKLNTIEARKKMNNNFEEMQSIIESGNSQTGKVKTIEVPDGDLLPVHSTICTIDDITNYLLEHITEVDGGRIFNKPVTKDGESLLIGLVHVLPDKDNPDNLTKYINLVKNMGKMPHINYNQKDFMGLPAIAHVLNSQNELLLAAFTSCNDLRYDTTLEFEFNRITDPKFKQKVLDSHLFDNDYNRQFKTIFGQPNTIY